MYEWLSTALTLGGYVQSHNQHKRELDKNNELTEKQIEEAERHHGQQLDITNELHNIQYEHNLNAAEREGLRDLWAQRNQKNQTSIITLTLLYSCCFVILVEGELPTNTSQAFVLIYGIVMSIEIVCITISLLLLLKVQSRMTHFNIFNREHIYNCGQTHETFDSYYIHHCQSLKRWSIRLCNLGLIFIYITGIILWGSRFLLNYNSVASMVSFTVFNVIGIIAILFTLSI